MGFNQYVVVAAVLIGLAAGFSTIYGLKHRSEVGAVVVGLATAIGLTTVALVVVVLRVGGDWFALIHLVYVVVTIGVPLAATVVLIRASDKTTWFRLALLGLVLLAPIGLYATHIEPFWLRVDRVEVLVESTTAAEIRVGVLSDLQAEEIGDYENRAIDALLAERPDIVLIPGDVWQMSATDFDQQAPSFAAAFARLCDAVPHVFVVNGNTDNFEGLERITAGTHADVLYNEVAEITVGGTPIRIFGLPLGGDPDRFALAYAGFVEPVGGSAVEPLRIVLAHQPDKIAEFPRDDSIDLYVAGHTHGGQVAIPFFGPLATLSSVPRSVAAGGLHQIEGHSIYVSTGVGRERRLAPQVRFGVRPSIGILDLVGAADPTE